MPHVRSFWLSASRPLGGEDSGKVKRKSTKTDSGIVTKSPKENKPPNLWYDHAPLSMGKIRTISSVTQQRGTSMVYDLLITDARILDGAYRFFKAYFAWRSPGTRTRDTLRERPLAKADTA
jgi:hypothetical protein